MCDLAFIDIDIDLSDMDMDDQLSPSGPIYQLEIIDDPRITDVPIAQAIVSYPKSRKTRKTRKLIRTTTCDGHMTKFKKNQKNNKKLTTPRIEKMVLENARHLENLVQCDSSSHVNFFDQMINQLNSLVQVEMFQINHNMDTKNMEGLRDSENRLRNIGKFIETDDHGKNRNKLLLTSGIDGSIQNIENLTLDNLLMLGNISSSNDEMKQIITSHENKNSQELMKLFSKQAAHSFSDFYVGLSNYQFLLHFGCDHLQSHYEAKFNQSLWGLDGSHSKFKKFNKLMTDLDNTRNYVDEYFLKAQELHNGINQMTKLIGNKIKNPSISNEKVKQLLLKNVSEMNQVVHQHFTPGIRDRASQKRLADR